MQAKNPVKNVASVILAAGKSERMGSPKALLRLAGRTFLERVCDAVTEASIAAFVVVVGRHRNEIQSALPGLPFVFNPIWEQGMTTSLQAGIRSLPADIDGAVLCLVDHPWIEAATIRELLRAMKPGGIAVPIYAGRRGHPVAFSRAVLDEILELGPDEGANIVVRRDPGRVVEVPMNSPGILCDVDTVAQFEALLEDWRGREADPDR
ncbi:MAG TPA: nucleotidyltransferase family protein [Terriglobia bacterium]|nr:nucleotidyltransferase family protein [Terriglobia bacterium]